MQAKLDAHGKALNGENMKQPLASPARRPKACFILSLFAEVEHLEVTSRDKELPYSEDDCVASLSRIGCTDPHVPFPEAIQGDDFHLLFKFQSGQTIRIGAKTAQFVCDEKKWGIQQPASSGWSEPF